MRRLREHRLDLAAGRAIADVAEDHVAVGVLLDVEEVRGGERLERVERVQERPAAEEEGARSLELAVELGEQVDAAARRLRVEREAVLGNIWTDEAREALPDRRGLRVIADQ